MANAPYPTHLTLSDEERAKLGIGTDATHKPGSLPKSHRATVMFPDGTEGTCDYQRIGPQYHAFDFTYHDGTKLPRQYRFEAAAGLGELPAACLEMSVKAFADAIERERKERFARAVPPTDGSRTPEPSKFRLDLKKAKALGGKYALCLRIGARLVMASGPFDTLAEANQRWKERESDKESSVLIVACCNRLDRCWEQPQFNPLHADSLYAPCLPQCTNTAQ